MPQYGWKRAFGVITGKRKRIGMTDSRSLDLYQNFTGFWAFQVDFNNFQGFAGSEGDGGT
jgi:hypothetical protein